MRKNFLITSTAAFPTLLLAFVTVMTATKMHYTNTLQSLNIYCSVGLRKPEYLNVLHILHLPIYTYVQLKPLPRHAIIQKLCPGKLH